MFEGKNIHFSPTDKKPLCSYSGKVCRQRRLNGYAFCIRHILEDKSAPFKQCSYVTRNNSQKCLNAIPTNQDRGYCHSHMQVVGIIPKTERKPKAQTAKSESNGSSPAEKSTPSPSSANSVTKDPDPGAVFKFVEEDSSDSTDIYSYKYGLSNSSLNGKARNSRSKDSNSNSPKDVKNGKPSNGFTASPVYTTKKITDKNKNIYTAFIPTNDGNSVSNKTQSKKKNYNTVTADNFSPVTQQKSSSRVVQLSIRVQKESKRESELKSYDVDEIRQFEQLKTLKKLDKSLLSHNSTSEEGRDAKTNIFPRLVAKTSSISTNGISSRTTNQSNSEDTSSEKSKSEILITSPAPPLNISNNNNNNNNVIIIKALKADSLQPTAISGFNETNIVKSDEKTKIGKTDNDRVINLYVDGNNADKSSSNNCNDSNSIDKGLKNRHEYLAQVRKTFKTQYKTIKKSSTEVDDERRSQKKFRDSVMRCLRIDSGVCAQVLRGYEGKTVYRAYEWRKSMEEHVGEGRANKPDYDDYEFLDESSSSSLLAFDLKSNKNLLNSKQRKTSEKEVKKVDSFDVVKSKAQRQSVKKTGESGLDSSTGISGENDTQICSSPPSKHHANKLSDKCKPVEVTKELISSAIKPAKKKPKMADVVLVSRSPDHPLGNTETDVDKGKGANPIQSPISSSSNSIVASIGKKRRLEVNDNAVNESDIVPMNDDAASDVSNLSFAYDVGNHRHPATSSEDVGVLETRNKSTGKSQSSSQQTLLNSSINNSGTNTHELLDILIHSQPRLTPISSRHNQALELVLNSVGSSENAGTPDGVITDASFDSTFEHSTSSQQDCDFSDDDLDSFDLQIDPEIQSQANRLLEDNGLTEADFTELFPDNRMSDHKLGGNDLQELGLTGLEFDVNDIDYSLFANIFPNFPRTSQPESISVSNQF